jgi:hypothetical protein
MNTKFYEKLNYVSGFGQKRQVLADEVVLNPSLLIELVPFCFLISDSNSQKLVGFWNFFAIKIWKN